MGFWVVDVSFPKEKKEEQFFFLFIIF